MLAQEVDAFLQNSGLVHFASVAGQHGAQLLDEHIELVSPFLLGLISGNSVKEEKKQKRTYRSNISQRQ